MLCQYAMEEERGDVDTAETLQCCVQSSGRLGRRQRAQNGQRVSQYLWGESQPDHALETSAPKRGARHFLGTPSQTRARPRGIRSKIIPTDRATQSRVGLGEKKSWSYPLRGSES